MAFIRQYMEEAGDPFRFRLPKRIRKFRPGRFLGGVARGVAGKALHLIPGYGIASGFARASGMLNDEGDPEDYDFDGFDEEMLWAGDPRRPRPARKRKNAGSGPKAKAAKKAQKRAERQARAQRGSGGGKKRRGKKGKGISMPDLSGVDWGGIAENTGRFARGALKDVPGLGGGIRELEEQGELGATPTWGGAGGTFRVPKGARGFGARHRRTMNPANVKALRRSVRRIEGFEKLVKRVMPHLVKRHKSGGGGGHSRAKGHRSGCGCAVCKR